MKKIDYKRLFSKFISLFTNNWPLKLLSLALAICLWSGLITQDDSLTREKVFNDVAINVTNADTLRRNGFIIVSGLDDLPTVRLSADISVKTMVSCVSPLSISPLARMMMRPRPVS